MARKAEIGEFEQLVLLAALGLGPQAYAPDIATVLEEDAEREVSRGTLYAALDRLEARGMLRWELDEPTAERGGAARRRFEVTESGREALSRSRDVLMRLWAGVEDLLPDVS